MRYNIYVSNSMGAFNIFTLEQSKVLKIVDAYLNGVNTFTLAGRRYHFGKVDAFQIFTYELDDDPAKIIAYYKGNVNYRKRNLIGHYLPPSTLGKMGKEVTHDFIRDEEFGARKEQDPEKASTFFVHEARIKELKGIASTDFDLSRLIRLCEEMNDNFARGNFLSVGMIGRTIIHHVPPIFGFKTFEEVASNYGGPKEQRSFKKNTQHLLNSLKHIADGFLHQTVRKKESLPNETQVDFRQDMDVLLCEIVRILK